MTKILSLDKLYSGLYSGSYEFSSQYTLALELPCLLLSFSKNPAKSA